jgi:hypothetical protein
MNTDILARLYDQLDPFERLPLIIAAGVRGDKTEQRRLSESAPRLKLSVPDYSPLANALDKAVHYHLETLLDLAARFWQWWGIYMTEALCPDAADPSSFGLQETERLVGSLPLRSEGICRYYASRFIAYFDAWKRFSAEFHIDPEARLNFMIGWAMIVQTEKVARAKAFTPEEAEQFVRAETMPVLGDDSLERGPIAVESAEGIAAVWHIVLDKFLVQEGGTTRSQTGG